MQLGLFLKRAGLSLEESLAFWKQAFAPRTGGEKFEKEYAYNVRHSYGQEGRRKDYEAHSCLKVISATPGAGEVHGCPFKSLHADALGAALSRAGVPPMYGPSPRMFSSIFVKQALLVMIAVDVYWSGCWFHGPAKKTTRRTRASRQSLQILGPGRCLDGAGRGRFVQ
jgi:DNA primase large subunit